MWLIDQRIIRFMALSPKINPKLKRGDLTLGARTPSSANACAARASPEKTGAAIMVRAARSMRARAPALPVFGLPIIHLIFLALPISRPSIRTTRCVTWPFSSLTKLNVWRRFPPLAKKLTSLSGSHSHFSPEPCCAINLSPSRVTVNTADGFA